MNQVKDLEIIIHNADVNFTEALKETESKQAVKHLGEKPKVANNESLNSKEDFFSKLWDVMKEAGKALKAIYTEEV